MFPPATVCKPYPIIFLLLLVILLARKPFLPQASRDGGGKRKKKRKKNSNCADLSSCTVIGTVFLPKDSGVNSARCVNPFQGQVKVAETGGATIMKVVAFFQVLSSSAIPALRHSHSGPILLLSDKLYYTNSRSGAPLNCSVHWLTVHAYCAGSMVKFKLGWRIREKKGGAFYDIC